MGEEAPNEIYLRRWAPGSAMEVFHERCYETDIKYHHDDKYQKVFGALKAAWEAETWDEAEDIMLNVLTELGELQE